MIRTYYESYRYHRMFYCYPDSNVIDEYRTEHTRGNYFIWDDYSVFPLVSALSPHARHTKFHKTVEAFILVQTRNRKQPQTRCQKVREWLGL